MINDDRLSAYLEDHLIAAESGVQLFISAERTWSNTPFKATFSGLRSDIAADREDLVKLVHQLGYSQGPVKAAVKWFGAQVSKAGPLNPLRKNRGIAGQLELEALQSAVHGKENLWVSLLELSRNDDRIRAAEMQRLKDRAKTQQDQLAHIMLTTITGRFSSS
ncbi:hypothetical protein V6S67_18390 [Arthrobacter sp. Soc17.1.1.1]|uniref:hypothetical protein n=1 Tax=Arthrobacter sp. Soc17.1.1.1 TaxID=3121277 RepID=UPI002FE4D68F